MLCLQLGIILLGIVATSLGERLHWAFIHYHKTGHDLCDYFSNLLFNGSMLSSDTCKNVVTDELHNVVDVDSERDMLRADTTIIRPYHFEFEKVFNVDAHSFRVVHFVREPFDMVISGYLYHRQVPYPLPEKFLGRPSFDPCEFNRTAMHTMFIPSLTSFTRNKVNISEMVDSVVQLCYALREKYPAEDFNKALIAAKHGSDVLDGMRLEACRALLNFLNGDILRMAYNTLQEVEYLKRHSNVVVRRTFTAEFPATNLSIFHNSTVNVFQFLMSPAATPKPFFECLSQEEAVRLTLTNAFSRLPKTYSHNLNKMLGDRDPDASRTSNNNSKSVGISRKKDKRAHITSDQISAEARAKYIKRLEVDPVLGPLLLIVRKIVFAQSYE